MDLLYLCHRLISLVCDDIGLNEDTIACGPVSSYQFQQVQNLMCFLLMSAPLVQIIY